MLNIIDTSIKTNCSSMQYHPIDIVVKSSMIKTDNPFYAEIFGEFKSPEGIIYKIPGFYDGNDTWKVRFSPDKTGTWEYKIVSKDVELGSINGYVECGENLNEMVHGGLKIDNEYPYHFVYQDGTHHYMMVYECDWLWAIDLGNDNCDNLKRFIDSIKSYNFNGVIMNVYAYSCDWSEFKNGLRRFSPPALCVWEGNNENPVHDRLNVEFFKHYDRVVDYLFNNGINAHIFFKVYNKNVKWPDRYSRQEDLYLKYVTARYQAYGNIIWDFTKEAYYEPDKEYIRDRIKFIKSNDAYKRLVTLHDDRVFYDNENYCKELDFATLQQHDDFYSQALLERNRGKWPIFNSEFGYEFGPGGKTDTLIINSCSPEEFINRAYDIACAGGYTAYYYTYTAWDVIETDHKPIGYKYLKIFYDFFSSIEWYKFAPAPEVSCWSRTRCLAKGREEFVLFVEKHTLLNLEIGNKDFSAYWLNIYTGEKCEVSEKDKIRNQINPEFYHIICPFKENKGVLYIKVEQ